nr:unnamed protein product [Callosobruchus analis]
MANRVPVLLLTCTPRIPKIMKNVQQINTMFPIGLKEDNNVCTTNFKPGALFITLRGRSDLSSEWGANANTLRTATLAFVYSTAEYCASVWRNSAHTHKVDVKINHAMRIVSGSTKSTPLPWLPVLANIAPPPVRREAAANRENPPRPTCDTVHACDVAELWREAWNPDPPANSYLITDPNIRLEGFNLPRRQWTSLNRFTTGHGRCDCLLNKWGYTDDLGCDCEAPKQTMQHLQPVGSKNTCSLSKTLNLGDDLFTSSVFSCGVPPSVMFLSFKLFIDFTSTRLPFLDMIGLEDLFCLCCRTGDLFREFFRLVQLTCEKLSDELTDGLLLSLDPSFKLASSMQDIFLLASSLCSLSRLSFLSELKPSTKMATRRLNST